MHLPSLDSSQLQKIQFGLQISQLESEVWGGGCVQSECNYNHFS